MEATGCGRGQKWPKGLCDTGNGHWRPTAQFRGWRVGTSHQGRMLSFSFWFSCVRGQRLGEAWIPTGSKLFWEISRLSTRGGGAAVLALLREMEPDPSSQGFLAPPAE